MYTHKIPHTDLPRDIISSSFGDEDMTQNASE